MLVSIVEKFPSKRITTPNRLLCTQTVICFSHFKIYRSHSYKVERFQINSRHCNYKCFTCPLAELFRSETHQETSPKFLWSFVYFFLLSTKKILFALLGSSLVRINKSIFQFLCYSAKSHGRGVKISGKIFIAFASYCC